MKDCSDFWIILFYQICIFLLQKAVASFFLNSPVDIAPAYEGRATLEVDIDRGLATLHLKKLTMEDSRHYQCSVRIPNDDEGKPIASTSVLVLGEI